MTHVKSDTCLLELHTLRVSSTLNSFFQPPLKSLTSDNTNHSLISSSSILISFLVKHHKPSRFTYTHPNKHISLDTTSQFLSITYHSASVHLPLTPFNVLLSIHACYCFVPVHHDTFIINTLFAHGPALSWTLYMMMFCRDYDVQLNGFRIWQTNRVWS